MQQYHLNLKYSSDDRMCLTMKPHFYQKGMKDGIKEHAKFYKKCQLCKIPKGKHRKLPAKDAGFDTHPQKDIHVNIIDPW